MALFEGLFDERLLIDGKRVDVQIQNRTTAATLTRPMEGASSLELTISDPEGELLRSGVLTQPGEAKRDRLTQASWSRFGRARLTLDGAFFRLAGASGQYDAGSQQLTLTFEDEIWSLLRQHKGPMKAKRPGQEGGSGVTRAQFVARMIREVDPRPAYIIPELSTDQPIKGDLPEQRRERREKGFERGARLTVKGDRADGEQKRVLEQALTVADEEKAGDRATLALIVALIQESTARNLTGGHSSSVGVLQLLDIHLGGSVSTDGGRRDVPLVVRLFLTRGFTGSGGAIDVAADNPVFGPARVATTVQGNAAGEGDYSPWETEAERILEAWGGSGRVKIVSSKYEYRRLGGRKGEKDETSTECIRRLADEVRWRAWADENVFNLVTDPWLFQNRPVTTITPDTPGLASMNFTADVGIPVAEVKLGARTGRWDGAPGDCVILDDYGGLDGRWLTWELVHDLLTGDTDVTLRRPKPALPEPAPDRERRILTETARPTRGSARARVLEAAKRTLSTTTGYNYYLAGGSSAHLNDPTPPQHQGFRSDCSQWVHAVYLKAGLPSPGLNTDEQEAKATRTQDPKPGDLLLMSGHVELYIGDGKTIGHGSPPIDEGSVAFFKPRGAYFGTFPFLDD